MNNPAIFISNITLDIWYVFDIWYKDICIVWVAFTQIVCLPVFFQVLCISVISFAFYGILIKHFNQAF